MKNLLQIAGESVLGKASLTRWKMQEEEASTPTSVRHASEAHVNRHPVTGGHWKRTKPGAPGTSVDQERKKDRKLTAGNHG